MIGSFYGTFGLLLKRPLYFVPALIIAILNLFFILISIDNYYSFIYDAIILGSIPGNGIMDSLYYMLTVYAVDLFFISLTLFLTGISGIYALFVYASLLGDEKKSVVSGMIGSLSRIGEISLIVIFFFVACALFFFTGAMFFDMSLSGGIASILGGLLLTLLFILGFYASAKLVFAPVIMALERMKLKQALGKSWAWSGKRFFGIIIFLVLLSIMVSAISGFFFALEETLDSEAIGFVLVLLGTGLSGAFYHVAMLKYYIDSEKT
jgi:hypothetical protein